MAAEAHGLGSELAHFLHHGDCWEVRVHVGQARDWKLCTDHADEGLAANWCARAPHNANSHLPCPG